MPLNTGKWKIDANGFVGDLNIASVDGAGNLTGDAFGNKIEGFWDEASQRIMFQRIINSADPSTIQTYTGFMFQDPLRMQGVTGDIAFTLAGYFEAFSGGGGSSQRPLFGWYAQIGVISPCTAGQPNQPCSAGQPNRPCTAGQPNRPCLAGRPDTPCPAAKPDNICPGSRPV